MGTIIRGTTPTITFTFNAVDVADMSVVYLTLTQGETVIEYSLEDATVNENTLSWTLTQADTLKLNERQDVSIQCRYKLINGSAGASPIRVYSASKILKDGEI